MTNLAGRKLGKYELLERLGQGGMAEVYKAYQPGVERLVASKVLHGHLVDAGHFLARFQREARAIGRLHHPHIVRVIDFDVAGEVYYMIMDYIEGGTLSDYLKASQALAAGEALRLTAQLADALAYAHRQGMIHRDIKPSNILFVDSSHTQAVLTDFGLARLCDEASTRLTLSGALVGTPTYMSPEAVRGEVCDARSDIYSLGVVLYEMVTGKPPYVADTPYSMMLKQAHEPLPPPHTLNATLPLALEHLLLKALAKEPSARYQTAADLATAIHHAQTTLAGAPAAAPAPLAAPPAKGPPHPPQLPSSHWWLLAWAAGGVTLVALLTLFLLMHV